MRICVLVTCYNRRELTLHNIGLLHDALTASAVEFAIVLVDDGSDDGTADSVRERYPLVDVVLGTGSLFWSGGMRLAYSESLSLGKFDAYLLFNDDVRLDVSVAARAVTRFVERNRSDEWILVGATIGSDGTLTYSGYVEQSRVRALSFGLVTPVPLMDRECDTFNANFVIVPSRVMTAVGGIGAGYQHDLGDIALGLSARAIGVRSAVYGEPVGVCDRGPGLAERARRLPRRKRWTFLFSFPNDPRPVAYFAWHHRPRVLLPVYVASSVLWRLRTCLAA